MPAGVDSNSTAGDLIFCGITYASTVGFTPPTGWTLIDTQGGGDTTNGALTSAVRSSQTAWVTRTGSATATTFARTGGSNAQAIFQVWRWGGTPGTITLGQFSKNQIVPRSGTVTTGSVTTAANDSLILLYLANATTAQAINSVTATSPTAYSAKTATLSITDDTWQYRYTNQFVTEPVVAESLFDAQKTTAGATGTITISSVFSRVHNIHATTFYVGSSSTNYTLTASPGSYALTGQDANLRAARSISAISGSYALTGQSANLVYTLAPVAYSITADPGSYVLTGQAVNLTSALILTAAGGSYSLTGQTANLTAARSIVASPGSYSLTGQAANLIRGRRLVAAAGTYALTGQAASLFRSTRVPLDPGSYALTGNAATLTYTPGAIAYTLTAASGSYALSGQGVNFVRSVSLTASPGSYVLTGQATNLSRVFAITATGGSYSLTGGSANFLASRSLGAESGEYSLIGNPVNLLYGQQQPLFFIIG